MKQQTQDRFKVYAQSVTAQQSGVAALAQIDATIAAYFELERRQLIARLRFIDSALGRDQTIPVRQR